MTHSQDAANAAVFLYLKIISASGAGLIYTALIQTVPYGVMNQGL